MSKRKSGQNPKVIHVCRGCERDCKENCPYEYLKPQRCDGHCPEVDLEDIRNRCFVCNCEYCPAVAMEIKIKD